jgi:hypothetical protein
MACVKGKFDANIKLITSFFCVLTGLNKNIYFFHETLHEPIECEHAHAFLENLTISNVCF